MEKFDRHEWAQLVDTDSTTPDDNTHALSATPGFSGPPTMILSQDDMIGCVSSSSLKTTIQQLMHHLQVWMSILSLHPDLGY